MGKLMEYDYLLEEKPFLVETARQGRAICKKCKLRCVQGELRIAKLVPNPYGSGSGKMKSWYHIHCIFEMFLKQRQSTKRIETPDDIEGWELLAEHDKEIIFKKIKECKRNFENVKNSSKKAKCSHKINLPLINTINEDALSVSSDNGIKDGSHKDNSFREFRTVVASVTNEDNSSKKIEILKQMFNNGTDGTGFKGDKLLWCKLLLPSVSKRVYNLQSKQLAKIFSRIFHVSQEDIMDRIENVDSDIGQTIQYFFEHSKNYIPIKKSILTIHEVDEFLEKLTNLTKEDDQVNHFRLFIIRCTANDLKVIIRLIKHDLRMNAGIQQVLEGIHPEANQLFQACKDIRTVIRTYWGLPLESTNEENSKTPENKFSQKRRKSRYSDSRENKTEKRSPKRKSSTSMESPVRKRGKSEDLHKTAVSDNEIETEIVTDDDISHKTFLEQANVELENNLGHEIEKNITAEARKTIPNYFEKVKLMLEEGVAEIHAEWIRYFIAYGGTVLNTSECEEATHVLHLYDTVNEPSIQCGKSARHVIVEWIKDTVEKQCLQELRPYIVRWEPNS